MYQYNQLDELIAQAQSRGDKEVVINLIKARNAMVLANLIVSSSANVKLGWRGKCEEKPKSNGIPSMDMEITL
jgi:hypothetical protein